MQAYRGMDIGTAKPDKALRSILPHHLIDILEPSEQFTVGDFVRLAETSILEIRSRGKLPIVAGGTGYYVRNLVLGLPTVPAADPFIREEVARDLEEKGVTALRVELSAGDPESAARIHPNDHYRLTRALEILRATGKPLASFLPGTGEAGVESTGAWFIMEYRRPRDELRASVEERVDSMFASGLPEEVARLRAMGYGPEAPGMKAIGYSEFFELEAEGLTGPALLASARARITKDTMRYAKRQATFFRSLPDTCIIDGGPDSARELSALLLSLLEGVRT